jgi:Zn-dependent alcohol dehydrogenase
VPTSTRSAVCWEIGKPWEIVDCVLEDPLPGEVLVNLRGVIAFD